MKEFNRVTDSDMVRAHRALVLTVKGRLSAEVCRSSSVVSQPFLETQQIKAGWILRHMQVTGIQNKSLSIQGVFCHQKATVLYLPCYTSGAQTPVCEVVIQQ